MNSTLWIAAILLNFVHFQVAESVKQDLETIEIYYSETFLAEDDLVFRAGAKEEGEPFVSTQYKIKKYIML